MEATGLTHEALAELAGVGQTTFAAWKVGRRNPRVDLLEACANLTGYTLTIKPL